jgi:GT2 family glycosyltransferase
MKSVSAIIPYYEGRDQLRGLFHALSAMTIPAGTELEVVIADDGSDLPTDPTTWTHSKLKVKSVRQDHLGQSAATNLAVRTAEGNFIWLLAQDIRPKSNALTELLKRSGEFPGALVQGMICHDESLYSDPFTRYIAQKSGFQFAYGLIGNDDWLPPVFHYAPHALIERERFLQLDGYDEALPYGYQDTDFALRMIRDGGRLVLARQSEVIHCHAFEVWTYALRLKRLGGALIDFTLKWRPLEELDSLRPMLKVQLQYAAKVVAVARDIIRRWEITGEEPTGEEMDATTVEQYTKLTPLETAFHLVLNNSHARGIYEGMKSAGQSFSFTDVEVPTEITDDDKWNVLGWIDDVVGAKWGRNRT